MRVRLGATCVGAASGLCESRRPLGPLSPDPESAVVRVSPFLVRTSKKAAHGAIREIGIREIGIRHDAQPVVDIVQAPRTAIYSLSRRQMRR